MQMRRFSSPAALSCGLIALLLLMAGCGGSPAPRQTSASPQVSAPAPTNTTTITPIPMPTSLPAPVVQNPLDAAPTNCPASPPLQTMTQENFGGGFIGTLTVQGDSPAWQLGLGSGGGSIHLQQPAGTLYPSTKVMWLVGPNYLYAVTLSGHEVHTGMQLLFEVYPSNTMASNPSLYTTRAVLDPAAPNRGSTQNSTGYWNIWGIGIIALAAGCYELDASWAGGGWQAIYAFGS